MKVLVNRTAVAPAIPRKEWVYIPEQANLALLIETLAEQYGHGIRDELIVEGGLAKGVLVLINGRSAYQMDNLKTILKDGDKVYFTVMVTGG